MTSSMWLSAVLTFVGLATAVGLVHAPAGGTWRAQPRSSATSLLRSSRIATMQETGGTKITIRKPGSKSAAAADVGPTLADEDTTVTTVTVRAPAKVSDELAALKALQAALKAALKALPLVTDQRQSDGVAAAVNTLYDLLPADPPIALDPRLVGEWMLLGTTSETLISRQGLTSLGAAPFMNLCTLHVAYSADGEVTTKEVLGKFGEPAAVNELRGTISFTEDGESMLESYDVADLGGEASSPAFNGLEFALLESAITSCGKFRLGRDSGGAGVCIFKKAREGLFTEYLDERQLPTSGGTYDGNPTWKGTGYYKEP